MPRLSRLLLAMIVMVSLLSVVKPVRAQTTTSVTVAIDAIAPATVSGVAVLTSVEGGTNLQVLAIGAQPETTVIIHAGTCAAIDPAPVALLGDIGAPTAAGQVNQTLPRSLADLATGGFVIAFHKGLDFQSALACGQIPRSDDLAAEPTADAHPPDNERGYVSPTFGYSLALTDGWEVESESLTDGIETVVLVHSDGASISFIGHEAYDGDPAACLNAWILGLETQRQAKEIDDLGPYPASNQVAVEGDANRAWSTVTYRVQSQLTITAPVVNFHECRRMSATAVLEIDHRAPTAEYDAEVPLRERLVSSLTLANGSPAPQPTVAPTEPAPTVAPAPTEAPEPTANPACVGVADWYSATVQRLTRLSELLTELTRAQNSGDMNKAYLVYLDLVTELDSVIDGQRRADTPDAAADLNDRLIAALDRYRVWIGRYLQALENATGISATEAQGIITEGNDALVALGQAGRAVETFVKECGISVSG